MLIMCIFCAAQNFFCVFCAFSSETPVLSDKFIHLTHGYPFEKFSLDALNSKQKHFVKTQSTGVDFEIHRSSRVEKILTGSISAPPPDLGDFSAFSKIT